VISTNSDVFQQELVNASHSDVLAEAETGTNFSAVWEVNVSIAELSCDAVPTVDVAKCCCFCTTPVTTDHE